MLPSGELGIRTLGEVSPHTRFPVVRLRPLSQLSTYAAGWGAHSHDYSEKKTFVKGKNAQLRANSFEKEVGKQILPDI